MKKLLTCLLLALLLITDTTTIYASGNTAAQTQDSDSKKTKLPKVGAKAAILMDANTGEVLFEKKADSKMYPASITKIMTVLLALENSQMDEIVTFSHQAVYGIEPGSSHIGIDEGEKLTMKDCIYGILLESANEVSAAVGEHVSGGSEADFAKMMTEKAAELGCTNTNFTNANGLHNDKHYTSARDMALITKEALTYPDFRRISGTVNYTIPKTNKNVKRSLWNHHKMVKYQNATYSTKGVEGGKTGYTTMSRGTLVTFAKIDDLELICVVMRCEGKGIYYDTKTLLEYGFKNYKSYYPASDFDMTPNGENTLTPSFSKLSMPYDFNTYIDADFSLLLPANVDINKIESKIKLNMDPTAKTFGTIQYSYQGEELGSTPIYFKDMVVDAQPVSAGVSTRKKIRFSTNLLIIPAIVVAVIVVLIGIFFFTRALRRKRNRLSYRRRSRRRSGNNRRNY